MAVHVLIFYINNRSMKPVFNPEDKFVAGAAVSIVAAMFMPVFTA